MENLLPWDITDEHPVTVLIFISWNIVGAIKKIYEPAFIQEIFRSMGSSTIAFNEKRFTQQIITYIYKNYLIQLRFARHEILLYL